ncbi:MAG: hypothetical protein J6M60_01020 [Clostridia bacterium]|nr:hypothetical protein [Clostridia bacterium]
MEFTEEELKAIDKMIKEIDEEQARTGKWYSFDEYVKESKARRQKEIEEYYRLQNRTVQ